MAASAQGIDRDPFAAFGAELRSRGCIIRYRCASRQHSVTHSGPPGLLLAAGEGHTARSPHPSHATRRRHPITSPAVPQDRRVKRRKRMDAVSNVGFWATALAICLAVLLTAYVSSQGSSAATAAAAKSRSAGLLRAAACEQLPGMTAGEPGGGARRCGRYRSSLASHC